jgi:O-acetylhomoserine (thiol)-lyase
MELHQATQAIHAGYTKDQNKTMAVPIYQTTAYQFEDTDQAANRFALKELGNIYTRLANPTSNVLEERFAAIEGAAACIATASGMSAIFYAIVNITAAGENIIASNQLYGGTLTLFAHTLKRFGIELRTFDIRKPETIEALIDDKTTAIFFESLSNPSIAVADPAPIVAIAKKHKIITVCDNTVATPFLFAPMEHGIDIAVYSASKYITGQGLAIGGLITERKGLIDLIKGNPRYRHFNEPDASYHGLVYTDLPFPPFSLRVRLALLRDIGATPAPFSSWLFIQGLEHLALRMEKHSANALKVAQHLAKHPKVKRVNYPGLSDNENYANAQKYLPKGASGLLSFEVADMETAKKIIDQTALFSLVANIGDSKSIITHPASTTHMQLTDAELAACGVSKGLIRLSIGLEDADDIIADLDRAIG